MDCKDFNGMEIYGNAENDEIAVAYFKDKGHVHDIMFGVEARDALCSAPLGTERADTIRKEYTDFCIGKVIKKNGNEDTMDWFDHRKWLDEFFLKFRKDGWTHDVPPTLTDCKKYEEEGLGDCLPLRAVVPFIRIVSEEEAVDMHERCVSGELRVCDCKYKLRRDAELECLFLLREDFAILCSRRKRYEVEGREYPKSYEEDMKEAARAEIRQICKEGREQLELF